MRERDPAIPPERMLVPNFTYWGASFWTLKTALMVSLKAKLRACVGKYLNTLAKLPEKIDVNAISLWSQESL